MLGRWTNTERDTDVDGTIIPVEDEEEDATGPACKEKLEKQLFVVDVVVVVVVIVGIFENANDALCSGGAICETDIVRKIIWSTFVLM